ncbi:V-type proton ATPase subunit [Sphaerulina musiva]
MANGWSLIISIIVVAAIGLAAWFLSPKGENQTYAIPFLCMAGARSNVHKSSVWRSTIILSTASCWLMWAITFLAQWHPLIVPERSDLRMEVEPPQRF